MTMATAIFIERFQFDRRPKQAIAFDIAPSPTPQSYPQDVVDAAIAAGKAKRVPKTKKRVAAPVSE
jgi:hypothetical protein